jgi:hypothetical protein
MLICDKRKLPCRVVCFSPLQPHLFRASIDPKSRNLRCIATYMAFSGLASFLNFAVHSVYPLIDLVSTNTYHKVTQQDRSEAEY